MVDLFGDPDLVRRIPVSIEKCKDAALSLLTTGGVKPVDAQAILELEHD